MWELDILVDITIDGNQTNYNNLSSDRHRLLIIVMKKKDTVLFFKGRQMNLDMRHSFTSPLRVHCKLFHLASIDTSFRRLYLYPTVETLGPI